MIPQGVRVLINGGKSNLQTMSRLLNLRESGEDSSSPHAPARRQFSRNLYKRTIVVRSSPKLTAFAGFQGVRMLIRSAQSHALPGICTH